MFGQHEVVYLLFKITVANAYYNQQKEEIIYFVNNNKNELGLKKVNEQKNITLFERAEMRLNHRFHQQ